MPCCPKGSETVQCGWLKDRFGVSLQIVPTALGEMLRDAELARSDRVMRALMQMIKLDIAALKKVYDGGAIG
jgi:predicted 3-demethylubiquinone-9 3-methyltransferase (glyoxalase superfamily)